MSVNRHTQEPILIERRERAFGRFLGSIAARDGEM
jgi:hypothetical protein